ncbi:MAG: hypothetical protein KF775_12615 [Cyclobacteriaceae bacterium]|nr:hypothetical protein [Cytophagales bacterium]MBX2900490.1 hypothetical protein [Cyclobacteriaceae bacterium]
MSRIILFGVAIVILGSCSIEKLYSVKQTQKNSGFEQVNFNDLLQRYMYKPEGTNSIEGVYAVSVVVLRKGKPFLSSVEREKIVDRKENYGTVAILRDPNNASREYLEISLEKTQLSAYAVRGEFTKLAESNLLIYRHFEPRQQVITYTFTYDSQKDILEGVRKENSGNSEFTYTLTYVKLHPKR